jgi:hypothetical protein
VPLAVGLHFGFRAAQVLFYQRNDFSRIHALATATAGMPCSLADAITRPKPTCLLPRLTGWERKRHSHLPGSHIAYNRSQE